LKVSAYFYIWSYLFIWESSRLALQSKEARVIIKKLDSVKLELLRLRAQLLPEVEPTKEERKEILAGKREYSRGQSVTLRKLLKTIGE
jgi:hypothetical protein